LPGLFAFKFFYENVIFDLRLFGLRQVLSGKKLGHKTRAGCKFHVPNSKVMLIIRFVLMRTCLALHVQDFCVA
jgi:hypothetical protein